MIKSKIKINEVDKGFSDIMRGILDISKAEGTVGLHSDAKSYPNGKSVVDVGAMQEFGAKGVMFKDGTPIDIPSRPFMRGTFDDKVGSWISKIKKDTRSFAGQKSANVGTLLDGIGEMMEKDIKRSIISINTPKNSARTLRFKKGNNPLVDTLHMHNSIDHKERTK